MGKGVKGNKSETCRKVTAQVCKMLCPSLEKELMKLGSMQDLSIIEITS